MCAPPPGTAAETSAPRPGVLSGEKAYAEMSLDLWERKEQLQRLIDEIGPELRRIPTLKDEYARAADPEALVRLRNSRATPVRARISGEFNPLWEDFLQAKMRLNHVGTLMSLAVLAQGRGASGVAKGTAVMATIDRFQSRLARFAQESTAILAEEEAFFAKARMRLAERRRAVLLSWLAAAVGAGAGLGCVLILWRRRRRLEARPLEPGSIVGGEYRVDRELGRGRMAVVYEARDLSLDRKVALKRMLDAIKDPAELDTFLLEARAAAALKHPNIVGIFTVLREPDRLCLVLELVEGETLARRLARGGRLPLRLAKSVVLQAAAALDHAHERGILHRDLNPGNIMLRPDGLVKVMDFGLARRAMGSASKTSDVQALAACAHEMLAGTPSGLPREADEILELRFPSAGEFARAFDALPEPR